MEETEPTEIIRREGLSDAVTALVNLIETQPRSHVVRTALELAVVMGVYAGEKRQARGEAYSKLEKVVDSEWSGASYTTYGDMTRRKW